MCMLTLCWLSLGNRNSLRGTAVCAYKFSEIVSVFEGAYKEQRTAYSNWLPVREFDVPEPHPAKVRLILPELGA